MNKKAETAAFPTTIYRVSLASKDVDGCLKATITPIPARLTEQLVLTANKRRIKMDRMGKVEFIASSDTLLIARVYTLIEQDIPALIEQMLERMQRSVAARLSLLVKLHDGLKGEVSVRRRDWEQ